MTKELEILERVLDYFNSLETGFPKELYEEVFQIVSEKVFMVIDDAKSQTKC